MSSSTGKRKVVDLQLAQEDPQPFSKDVMEELVPLHFMIPKITPFYRIGDPESHLEAF